MFIVPDPQAKAIYQKRVFQLLGSACLLSLFTGLMLSPARAACMLTTGQYTVNVGSTCVDNTASFSLVSRSSQIATLIVHDGGALTFTGADVEIGVISGARHSVSVGYPTGAGSLIVDSNLKNKAVNGTNQCALYVTGSGSSATIPGNFIAIRNGGSGGAALQITAGTSLYVGGNTHLNSNVTNPLRSGGVNNFQGNVVATATAATAVVTTMIDSETEIIGELRVNAPHSTGIGHQMNGVYLTAKQISTVSAGGNAIDSTRGTISLGGLSQGVVAGKTVVSIGPQASFSLANAKGVMVGGTQDQTISLSGNIRRASSALLSNTVTGQKSDV